MKPTFPDQADVLIVGAGPAGLAAASRLKDSGADVLLADARPVIGTPLRCAEVTRPGFFEIVGVEPRPGWARWTYRNGRISLDRKLFEYEMSLLLADAGIRVRPDTSAVAVGPFDGERRPVTLLHERREHTVRARLVIAADGVSSTVAGMAGLPTRLPLDRVASCVAYRIAGARVESPGEYHLDFAPELRPFYFWVIPCSPSEASVGLGVPGDRGFRAPALLEAFLRKSPRISGGRRVETIVGIFPSCPPMERPLADGLLVAGGAARFVTAAYGEGIEPAALSGRAAAACFLALERPVCEARALAAYRQGLEPLYRRLRGSWQQRRNHEQRA